MITYYVTELSFKKKGVLMVVHGDMSCTGIKHTSNMIEVTRQDLAGRKWRKCAYCA